MLPGYPLIIEEDVLRTRNDDYWNDPLDTDPDLALFAQFLRKALVVDPSKRPTAKELQTEDWVRVPNRTIAEE